MFRVSDITYWKIEVCRELGDPAVGAIDCQWVNCPVHKHEGSKHISFTYAWITM